MPKGTFQQINDAVVDQGIPVVMGWPTGIRGAAGCEIEHNGDGWLWECSARADAASLTLPARTTLGTAGRTALSRAKPSARFPSPLR
ncbi:hypothetical protein ACFCWG_09570 [Streptomyces sp. NPDC056390]|uniref:hypothetical protein n=1 Tax=Streptomyces sp. NPDC056390 TaxID=3345806 RepID=UPI0035D6E0FE